MSSRVKKKKTVRGPSDTSDARLSKERLSRSSSMSALESSPTTRKKKSRSNGGDGGTLKERDENYHDFDTMSANSSLGFGSTRPQSPTLSVSPDKLNQMGVIDLRSTRPPKMNNNDSLKSENSQEVSIRHVNKTVYQEIVNAKDLNDEPPPPVQKRRVDAASLKAEKEKSLFGSSGNDLNSSSVMGKSQKSKSSVPFSNITSDGLQRLRAMLSNFCKKEDGTFYDDINLREYGIDSGQVITNGVVQELCSVQPSLTKLDLSYCQQVSDVGLWAIARHCRSMKHLVLSGCDTVTNIGLRSLSLSLSEITILNFNHCHLLDDIGLTVISTGKWKILELYLQDCIGITDNGVGKLAKAQPSLKKLDLQGCSNVGEFGDKAIKEIGAFCGNLEYLDLGGCRRVEDAGLRALAIGCPFLKTLKLAGCDALTSISLKALCKHSKDMQTLQLGGCRKFTDKDFETFLPSAVFRKTITSLDISGCASVSDKGVAVLCNEFGSNLYDLALSKANVTDFSSMLIGNLCPKIRTLDFSSCDKISDTTVHTVARTVTNLTTLKLNGTTATTRALVQYVGSQVEEPLEFCQMANKWLGFQPKGDVAGLIAAREIFKVHTRSALLIQCALRRKFAYKRYRIRRRWWLMTTIMPKAQAHIRGMIQRVKFKEITDFIFRIRMAIKIQSQWRKFVAYNKRLRKLKFLKFSEYREKCATLIQKRYRGMVGRGIVIDTRNIKMNKRVAMAKIVAKQELAAIIVQRTITAWLGRVEANKRITQRIKEKKRKALEERMMRTIQRVSRGRLGRKKAAHRKWEVEHAYILWCRARDIQRCYRGLIGRRRFAWFLEQYIQKVRNAAATYIQKMFRGFRGKLLGAIARQLKILRIRKATAAVMIQRNVRGMIARESVIHYKQNIIRDQIRKTASILIQRIFRGHKGREARAIEKELRTFEGRAKPLVDLIKRLEAESLMQAKSIARIEAKVKRSEGDLFIIERELAMCMATTSKYCDSARINNTPQRFLTKYLRVRLKDHYEHEKVKTTHVQPL